MISVIFFIDKEGYTSLWPIYSLKSGAVKEYAYYIL